MHQLQYMRNVIVAVYYLHASEFRLRRRCQRPGMIMSALVLFNTSVHSLLAAVFYEPNDQMQGHMTGVLTAIDAV